MHIIASLHLISMRTTFSSAYKPVDFAGIGAGGLNIKLLMHSASIFCAIVDTIGTEESSGDGNQGYE